MDDYRIKIGDDKYCIIPTNKKTCQWKDEAIFPGGPSFFYAEREKGTGFLFDGSKGILDGERTIVLLEEDIWTSGDWIASIGKDFESFWPVFPISVTAARTLGVKVLTELMLRMRSERRISTSGRPELHATLLCPGLSLKRTYSTFEVKALGVAAWPPRAVETWQDFYFLVAPGTESAASATDPFGKCSVTVLGADQEEKFVTATATADDSTGVFIHCSGRPRLLCFVNNDSGIRGSGDLGLLPLRIDTNGLIGPGSQEKPFGEASLPARSRKGKARISVDFGTTNTAVGISWNEEPETRRLKLRAGAKSLWTDLKPFTMLEYRIRFGAEGQAPDPLPTLVWEGGRSGAAGGAPAGETDQILRSLFSSHCIPGLGFSEHAGGSLLDAGESFSALKQDFKWKHDDDSGRHRAAFLAHLGLMVAWAVHEEGAVPMESQVVFTFPLSFTKNQLSLLRASCRHLTSAMSRNGLLTADAVGEISESLANVYWAKSLKRGEAYPSDRHVVIDIGGGTVDLAVFAGGKGDGLLLLDSLKIGGKDIAHSLIPAKCGHDEDRLLEVLNAVVGKKSVFAEETVRKARSNPDRVQALVLRELAKGNVADLRVRLGKAKAGDILAEMSALLSFATVYGIVLAVSGQFAHEEPVAARTIHVYMVGLGSKLLALAPGGVGTPGRKGFDKVTREVAQKALTSIGSVVPDIQFVSTDVGKDSVCLGACNSKAGSDKDAATPMRTLWWADLPETRIRWNTLFDKEARDLFQAGEVKWRGLSAEVLGSILRSVLEAWGKIEFDSYPGKEIRRKLEQLPAVVSALFTQAFSESEQAGQVDFKEVHPLGFVLERLKTETIPEIIEEPGE